MALKRDVTVGFRGANNKIERVNVVVPAEWISGDKDAMREIVENTKLRTRLSVNPETALWVEIGEEYDDEERWSVA
jgi:hypothetical protein